MKKERLKFYDVFYIFIFGCVFGWIVECLWTYLKKGIFINHSAFIIGPINAIYGLGAVILTLVLFKMKKSNIIKIFLVSFLAGTILEYVIHFLMDNILGFVAWDYSTKFMNINGRVCLPYSIFWGILGIIWIKLMHPLIQNMINKINIKIGKILMCFLIIFLITDGILTLMAIERAKEQIKGNPPNNIVEKFFDKNFDYEYLNNMFNYRWKLK